VIQKDMPVAELAAIISEALKRAGIRAVLSGGSVVTIYAGEIFVSKDLDFVSDARLSDVEPIMTSLGFSRKITGLFEHSDTEYLVDFERGPLAVGEEVLEEWGVLETAQGQLEILTPTQCVKDRLTWFYHSNDRQSLKQAVAVATCHAVDFDELHRWSDGERSLERYELFLNELHHKTAS